jgi:hypothetical protein
MLDLSVSAGVRVVRARADKVADFQSLIDTDERVPPPTVERCGSANGEDLNDV